MEFLFWHDFINSISLLAFLVIMDHLNGFFAEIFLLLLLLYLSRMQIDFILDILADILRYEAFYCLKFSMEILFINYFLMTLELLIIVALFWRVRFKPIIL